MGNKQDKLTLSGFKSILDFPDVGTDRGGNVTVLRWSPAHPSISPSLPLLLIPHLSFPSLSHFCSHGLISHTHLASMQWCRPLPLLIVVVIHIENHPSITLLSLIPPSLLSWSHTMNASIHIRRLYHHLLMSFVCKIPISLIHFAIWHSHMVSMAKMGISAVVCAFALPPYLILASWTRSRVS